ncbi:acetyl-CoA carboxylase biotin carboxyl carrier protein [Mesorhizobium loti]|uniref:Acetyl-CoA carboxylase biotin carboxyl carrier protein n=1 Tax=Rhizobium loti TaxID=381 RepID=A0A8E3B7Q6_RHILI|nr:biotin attachment protein [Mesorhizobium loti]PWJ94490.1 acetyl-CoA carboxylase biotin carboxyl carrier protein [Mesorhizobium loti]
MTVEEIERLTAWCASAGIGEIELAEAGFSLRLLVQSVVAPTPVAATEAPKAETVFKGVRAPGVGVFRLDHPTTGRSVAAPGQMVRKGETVGVLQVGPCLKAVLAPADGVLGAALAEDGAVVGYGTPLYELV